MTHNRMHSIKVQLILTRSSLELRFVCSTNDDNIILSVGDLTQGKSCLSIGIRTIAGWLVGWLIGWLVDWEHRASVKRLVSLQFLNLRHSVRLLGRVISPSQGRYLTQTQNKHKQTSMPQMSQCLITKVPRHEGLRWSGGIAPPFLIPTLGGQFHNPAVPIGTGDWVDPRASLDAVKKKKKNLLSLPGIELRPSNP
jgi:hypothetical protein